MGQLRSNLQIKTTKFPKNQLCKINPDLFVLELKPNKNFNLKYEFSADNNIDTINSSKIDGEIKINNFVTSFEF